MNAQEMISALYTNQSLHHAGLRGEQRSREDKEAEVTPTCLHDDRHGGLLNYGSYPRESGEAAVVSSAVLLHSVREVEVSIQAHGHPLILFYVLEIWGQNLAFNLGHLFSNQKSKVC